MERIPILKMGDYLLITIQVDMHDRLAITLQEDLTDQIVKHRSHGVLIDISALEMVDYVTVFEEDEPSAVIAKLQPDIHCKGEEYANGDRPVPERSVVEGYGGTIRFLPLHPGRSTTGLLERIRAGGETKSS